MLVFLFSTREALKEAKGRQRELEAEVGRVTCQLKEAMDKMVEQKEEEINRVRGWTDEQQERLQAEAKSKEESLRYTQNYGLETLRKNKISNFFSYQIYIFLLPF